MFISSPLLKNTIFTLIMLSFPGVLLAHIKFEIDGVTPPRMDNTNLKNKAFSCGYDPAASALPPLTNRISVFVVNETVALNWVETVDHQGSFFVDFSLLGDDTFDNLSTMVDPITPFPSGSTTQYHNMIYTMPADTCDQCVIRLQQDMLLDGNGRVYFSCADVRLVSGADKTPPNNVTVQNSSTTNSTANISWLNPMNADFSELIIIRNNSSTNNDALADRKQYLLGDMIGESTVVYTGTGESFIDTGLQAGMAYTYRIFTKDEDYNYNGGEPQYLLTQATTPPDTSGGTTGGGATGGGGTTSGGGTTTGGGTTGGDPAPSSDESAGGLFALLALLVGFFGLRKFSRRVGNY